jgi:hypothetical protein
MNKPKNGPFGAPSPRPGPAASGGDRPQAITPPDPVQVPVEAALAEHAGDSQSATGQDMVKFWQEVAEGAAQNAREAQLRVDQLENENARLRVALAQKTAAIQGWRENCATLQRQLQLVTAPSDREEALIARQTELGWRIYQLEERLQEYQQADEARTACIYAMEQALEEVHCCASAEHIYPAEKLHDTLSYLARVAAAGLAGTYPDETSQPPQGMVRLMRIVADSVALGEDDDDEAVPA